MYQVHYVCTNTDYISLPRLAVISCAVITTCAQQPSQRYCATQRDYKITKTNKQTNPNPNPKPNQIAPEHQQPHSVIQFF